MLVTGDICDLFKLNGVSVCIGVCDLFKLNGVSCLSFKQHLFILHSLLDYVLLTSSINVSGKFDTQEFQLSRISLFLIFVRFVKLLSVVYFEMIQSVVSYLVVILSTIATLLAIGEYSNLLSPFVLGCKCL